MNKTILTLSLLFSTSLYAVDLKTVAEKSDWKITGQSDEVARLCKDFQKTYPKKVKCRVYGKTPEGHPLHALIVGDLTKPTLWAQAGIHAGEIDGKDAVFWILREALEGKIADPFQDVSLVFIPIVNQDGHDRFGKWNRPNQVGPEEMGWRTTAQNLNMNRDFAKAEAPEMQALLRLWHEIDPLLSLDLHVTDGAHFQPEVGLIILPNPDHGQTPLHHAGLKLEESMLAKMKARSRLALNFYPSFEDEENPLSGFSRYVSGPRFSQGYWSNCNRLGMLVETHSWKNYANRVLTHRETVLSALESLKENAGVWQQAALASDREDLSKQSVDLEWKHNEKTRPLKFDAYKFSIENSKVSGGKYIRYDLSKPEVWDVPFYYELQPTLTIQAPAEGYFIPASAAGWAKEKLVVHSLRYQVMKKNIANLQAYNATETTFSPTPFEGRQTLAVKGEWSPSQLTLHEGALFVPIKQPKARLVMQLFEPQAKDSFLAWGFFNAAFEQKEYMEAYVAEDVAAEMMKDEKIKSEFNAKLKADSNFAKDPAKRLEFFYRKHSSWDNRYNVYPVMKR